MESHTGSSSGQTQSNPGSFNDLILMKVRCDDVTEKTAYFLSEDGRDPIPFMVRIPRSEFDAMGHPTYLSFGLSTLGLSVAGRSHNPMGPSEDHDVRLYDDARRLERFIPMSPEFLEKLSERFSDPVQLKIVNGELVLREMKQIAGIEDSGYEAWAPQDGLSA